jgi:hypothetical protein
MTLNEGTEVQNAGMKGQKVMARLYSSFQIIRVMPTKVFSEGYGTWNSDSM